MRSNPARTEVYQLLKSVKAKFLRTAGDGHPIYQLPNGHSFKLPEGTSNKHGIDARAWLNNLSELRRELGVKRPKVIKSTHTFRKISPHLRRQQESEEAAAKLKAAANTEPTELGKPEEPELTPELARQHERPGPAQGVMADPAKGKAPGHSGQRAEPSARTSRGHSLAPEIVAAANRQLQETGSADSILKAPLAELTTAFCPPNGNGNGNATQEPATPSFNYLDRAPTIFELRDRHEKLRSRIDVNPFIVDALMFLCESVSALLARPVPSLVQTAAPAPAPQKPKREYVVTPLRLAYSSYLSKCFAAGMSTAEAGPLWKTMPLEEKMTYAPTQQKTSEQAIAAIA